MDGERTWPCLGDLNVTSDGAFDRRASGDAEQALEAAFNRYYRPLFRFLIATGCRPEEAEELAQEVFLRFHGRMFQKPPIENPRAWLFQVAYRAWVDMIRARHDEFSVDADRWTHIQNSLADSSPTPEDLLIGGQESTSLQRALETLPERQRQYLVLRAEGLLLRDIASIYNVSVAAVADGLLRGTARLRKLLSGTK